MAIAITARARDEHRQEIAAACADLDDAFGRLVGGAAYYEVHGQFVTARDTLERNGESVAASYLYFWQDPVDSSRAGRATFWVGAFDLGRSEQNPGLLRIDELCGRLPVVKSEGESLAAPPGADRPTSTQSTLDLSRNTAPVLTTVAISGTAPLTAETGNNDDPTSPMPDSTAATDTTAPLPTYRDGRIGSGTLNDPFMLTDRYDYFFDTFQAGFSVEFYPARVSDTGEPLSAFVCLEVGYQAVGASVDASTIASRVRLSDPQQGVLTPVREADGVAWPDGFVADLQARGSVVSGNILSAALCSPTDRTEMPSEPFLVNVDGEYYTLSF